MSVHARKGLNCLDCHQVAAGQKPKDHHGFVINTSGPTPANCRACHEPVYQQFVRSLHAAASWAAVAGDKDFSTQQVAFAEQFQPGGGKRPPHGLAMLRGCGGHPERLFEDGSIGNCTACHTRHTSSVEFARLPTTCGQCHLGPDHSQMEIYTESKHGTMFAAQRNLLKLSVSPAKLTTRDMFVPTCATCHMSGINGRGTTHDPSDRLSYYLFSEITKGRPNAARTQAAMKDICQQCHTPALVDRVYADGKAVVESNNDKVLEAKNIMKRLYEEGLLPTNAMYAQPIQLQYFDLWVIFLALGGFVGNFIFSVTDHAQNGFYHSTEWIPVISSALAVGFLFVPLVMRVTREYLRLCALVMVPQAAVGVIGFVLHFHADWHGVGPTLFDRIVYGAPVFAPMLFPDLVLLASVGLWVLYRQIGDWRARG